MEHQFRDIARQQTDQVRRAGTRFNHGSIVDDHGYRARELLRNRRGEVVAPSRDKGDFDSASGCVGDGSPINFRKLGLAVEKRAVNVERNQANRHRAILP